MRKEDYLAISTQENLPSWPSTSGQTLIQLEDCKDEAVTSPFKVIIISEKMSYCHAYC